MGVKRVRQGLLWGQMGRGRLATSRRMALLAWTVTIRTDRRSLVLRGDWAAQRGCAGGVPDPHAHLWSHNL